MGGANLTLQRCGSCGFVYLSSWEQSLANANGLYDYYARITDADLARRHSPENRARQQALLRELARYTRGRRLLDVGCGDGQLLRTATEEGWETWGIDLSPGAIRLCQKLGLRASQTDFFDTSLDEESFDVIVMSELIEHVPSPQRFLERAKELLTERGVLYLTTPNFGSLARRLLREDWSVIHPEHIGYFERSTLRTMAVEGAGFREIRIDANNIAPSTLVAWWRGRGATPAGSVSEAHRVMRQGLDQRLRRAFRQSRFLTVSKDLLNLLVSRAGLGDTLTAWFQKTPA
jgi:2-polyprenyl-3-methyl-5-hydroxy-6-metoxy-1,4-benzoquinol methylase